MAVNPGETNLITTQDNDKILSIDFIEKFNGSIRKILEVIGAANVIPMANGSTIKIYKSSIVDPTDTRAEGGIIPLTKVKNELLKTETIDIEFVRKATSFEEIQMVGREQAITKTDAKILRAAQKKVRNGLLASLADGTGSASGATLQAVLGSAWGKVEAAFDEDEVDVVAFVNPENVGDYLGSANLSVQTAFGMNYVENFLGYKVVYVTAGVEKDTVYATAADNLKLYYVDVNGDAGSALGYTTDETGYVGIKHYVGNERATAETGLVSGLKFLIERADGVIVGSIGEGGETGSSESGASESGASESGETPSSN